MHKVSPLSNQSLVKNNESGRSSLKVLTNCFKEKADFLLEHPATCNSFPTIFNISSSLVITIIVLIMSCQHLVHWNWQIVLKKRQIFTWTFSHFQFFSNNIWYLIFIDNHHRHWRSCHVSTYYIVHWTTFNFFPIIFNISSSLIITIIVLIISCQHLVHWTTPTRFLTVQGKVTEAPRFTL